MLCASLAAIQWGVCGHSLVFTAGGRFAGSFKDVLYRETFRDGTAYALAEALSTGMFALVTAALMIGSVAYRGRVLPASVFVLVWLTVVYDPIAYWSWNDAGWARKMGALDYAGGTPVHITAGMTALVYSILLGRRTVHELQSSRPHNMILVVVGTALMWVGWLGFNSGAALGLSRQAIVAAVNTQLSAAFGGVTWVLLDFHLDSEWSIVGFCSGIVAGLVTVTPGAGYVSPAYAPLFGIVGGLCCNFGTQLKFFLGVDDALDVLAIHGVGGIVGTLATGIFASQDLDPRGRGGLIHGNPMQLVYQLVVAAAGTAWSFGVSYVLLFLINRVKGLHLRVDRDAELIGLDLVEHDEFAYDITELVPTEPGVLPDVQSYSDDPDRPEAERFYPDDSLFPGRRTPL